MEMRSCFNIGIDDDVNSSDDGVGVSFSFTDDDYADYDDRGTCPI